MKKFLILLFPLLVSCTTTKELVNKYNEDDGSIVEEYVEITYHNPNTELIAYDIFGLPWYTAGLLFREIGINIGVAFVNCVNSYCGGDELITTEFFGRDSNKEINNQIKEIKNYHDEFEPYKKYINPFCQTDFSIIRTTEKTDINNEKVSYKSKFEKVYENNIQNTKEEVKEKTSLTFKIIGNIIALPIGFIGGMLGILFFDIFN